MALTLRKPVHKLISHAGAMVWLPPSCFKTPGSLAIPDVYTQDSAQQYPLGTKLEYADGRVFRYGKVGATSTGAPIARLVGNANQCPGTTGLEDVDGYEGNLYVAVTVGDIYCDLYQDQADVENFYEDGMLAVFPSGHYVEYRIAGNELGDGTSVRVYIDAENGFRTAMTAGTAEATGGTGVTAYKSIYSQMKQIGAEGIGYMSAIGMCLATGFTVNYFAWIQRRGRCLIGGGGGGTAHYRTATYNPGDGYGADAATYDPTSGYQMIGYWTQRTSSAYGDLEVWLNFE